MLIDQNVSLEPYNTFAINVNAQYFAVIRHQEEVKEIYSKKKFGLMKKLILGGGSNILFTRSFLGLVIKMEIDGIEVLEENPDSVLVAVGAGVIWHQLVLWAVEHDFGGIENLSLIPGTVGAAPLQNIGAYGVELKEVFHSLEAYEIVTGKMVRFYKEDCKFGYRYSVFKGKLRNQYVITKVYLRLTRKHEYKLEYGTLRDTLRGMGVDKPTLRDVSQAVINIRETKLPDPLMIGNAGSFFKNPVIDDTFYDSLIAAFGKVPGYKEGDHHVKVPAAWLIEKAGWKGKRVGNVGVHEKQALVLVNYGHGSGKELSRLADDIRKSVFSRFGIELDPEVNII